MNSILKKIMDKLGMDENDLLERTQCGKDQSELLEIVNLPEAGSVNSSLTNFQEAIEFIEEGLANNESFVIYGDYDVDGLTSTSIMKLALDRCKCSKCGFLIPSRYDDGYGLNLEKVKKMVSAGYNRLIAVDNGITKKNEIEYLLSNGVKVLVLDHHEEQKDSFPPFDGKDCVLYHRNDVSAACLALLVGERLMENRKPKIDFREEWIRYFFTLAGLAVLSDCMPLDDFHNVALAKLGLKYLNEGKDDPRNPLYYYYKKLVDLINPDFGSRHITFHDESFSIVSKLNSIGRMCGGIIPNIGAYYLQGETEFKGKNILGLINEINDKKKSLVSHISSQFKTIDLGGFVLLDLTGENVPSGVSGLLANSIMKKQKLTKPFLVICSSSIDKDDAIASFRSEKNYSLDKVLDSPTVRAYLKEHGGHAQACGFTLAKKEMSLALEAINEELKAYTPSKTNDSFIPIDESEIGKEMYCAFQELEPFGNGFERPEMGVVFPKSKLVANLHGKHCIARLDKGKSGELRKLVFFSASDFLAACPDGDVLLKGEIQIDQYGGELSYSYEVKNAISR